MAINMSGGSSSKVNKNTDYQAKINEAVKAGNMQAAAKYEQLRNEKISSTGDKKHQTTNNYSQYLNGGGSSGGGSSGGSHVGSSGSSSSWGSSGGGYTGSSSAAADVDWSNYIRDLYANGVTDPNAWAYGINHRHEKASTTPGMEKYINDNFQQWANAQYQQLLQAQEDAEEAHDYRDVFHYADEARNAAIQSGLSSLQQQIPGINQSYDELARQAYIQKMMAEKALPSQLDAVGITGQGASESALAQQNNAYLQTLSSSELARQNALQANQYAQQNVKNTADLQYAQDATNIALQQKQAAQARLAFQRQQQQDLVANALNAAGLTGYYGSNPTLGWYAQQNDNKTTDAAVQGQLLNNEYQKKRDEYYALYVDIYKQYGKNQAEAEYQAQLLANALARRDIYGG